MLDYEKICGHYYFNKMNFLIRLLALFLRLPGVENKNKAEAGDNAFLWFFMILVGVIVFFWLF